MMCCYYPTTTVAIDDDVDFLKVITQHLEIADCISFSSPSKAVESLKNKQALDRLRSHISSQPIAIDNFKIGEDYAFQINMHKLHNEIYSKNRFDDASVLIIDYHMGETSGIDVCEALSNHPARKILLTGGKDKEKIVIEAFNKGLIHRFINKSDPIFPALLKQAITMLREVYFRDLTTTLLPHIATTKASLLQHPAYINFTKNLHAQFNTVEHYLIDTVGSSLLIDADGNPLWLVIKHESEIGAYVNIAKDQDDSNPSTEALVQREKIPFFFLDEDFQKPVSAWEDYLYPAHLLTGINGYYYTVIKGHIRNNLVREKIISYNAYKRPNQNIDVA